MDILEAEMMLVRLFRLLMRTPKLNVMLFVPCDEKGDQDLVRAFMELVVTQRTRSYVLLRLEEIEADFWTMLQVRGVHSSPSALVLFAHPSRELNGFLVNPSKTISGDVLLLRWWETNSQGAGNSYSLVVAHVCKGAHVFRRPKWRPVFPNWVSYENDIRSYLASALGTRRWEFVLDAIAEEVPKCKTAGDAKRRLRGIYRSAIRNLGATFSASEGDAVNLMYFQQCLESITSGGGEELK